MAKVFGVSEFEAAVRGQNQRLERALPRIVLKGARIVQDEIRRRAPRKTGKLISKLEVEEDTRPRSATAIVEIDDSGRGGEVHYAIFKEYGTVNMPATPFFRPGVEAARRKTEEQMANDIVKLTEET